jgi:hypothetical protein
MIDLLVRLWWTARWYFGGTQPLRTTWRASGAYIAAMQAAGFRVLR